MNKTVKPMITLSEVSLYQNVTSSQSKDAIATVNFKFAIRKTIVR